MCFLSNCTVLIVSDTCLYLFSNLFQVEQGYQVTQVGQVRQEREVQQVTLA